MQQLASFLSGTWQSGRGRERTITHAISGETLFEVTSEGLDMAAARRYAIEHGGEALRAMSFIERAAMLKAVAKHLLSQKDRFYALSAQTGATKADSWVDIEGGIGTLFTYASLGSRELPDDTLWPEDELIPLSKEGGFAARHVLTSKSGVAVHINAFNFPCWGMLEKLAPTWLAGMPAIIKPATATAQVTQAMVKAIVESGLVPDGAISLICGGAGDLLNQLDSQDVVTFTGSASTGHSLRVHPNIVAHSIPFTMEADSLNCCVLGEDVTPEQPEFALFIREVVREMTAKAGQKCTAIRRIIVPEAQVEAVSQALIARLENVVVGDPAQEGVKMGALVNSEQRADVQEKVDHLLASGCQIRLGGKADMQAAGAFFPPTLLFCPQPDETPAVHATEAFGPVATLMPCRNSEHAMQLARAGGGEELGGLRAVKHYLQRTAIQGSPSMLAAIGKQWVRGAEVLEDRVHPFRKYFEELQPGDSLLTPRRTMTEADIVNFACLSGDHFYAHMDKIGAAESIFGERVVHGYFLISAAAGLFVDAGVGPVIANYGMENLRFIEPVKPGDTIQVRLTCKRKTLKKQRTAEEKPTGVVEWAVEIFNQHQQAVALYSILTLVARQQGDF
ncbi:phenylacetic acid degradation bifunctional protein PaaZ [Enterobacter sp. 01-M-02-PA-ECC]|uniref:phenylacetic acid degradation bifunctional protein PaaZ n=1 Tax=unclassified Enterobacter TaxID=2608935 RepID=UPI0039E0E1B6